MNILVDTCVWSLALRRRKQDLSKLEAMAVAELHTTIEEGTVRLLGIVRQELLSGIKSAQQFDDLRETLAPFPDIDLTAEDYVEAAKLGNACRAKGVATHVVDMLLCAVAIGRGWEIFTTDPDFERYQKILGVRLHAF